MRVLVVEDDLALSDVVSFTLRRAGYEVTAAYDGLAAVEAFEQVLPDLILLDLNLPRLDGLGVCRKVRAVSDVPIIILSVRAGDEAVVRGLEMGADDYMVKPFSFDVLLAHIRALLRRREAEQPTILRYADLTLEPARHVVLRGERAVILTSLEFRLLHEFLRHAEQVLPKELLLDRVWGYDFGGNANVVEVYVKQLRQKLEREGESRLLHTIRGAGYVLRQEGP